jgi:hypothetical protein
MQQLYLDDHGTDRERFIAKMLALKACNPEAYAVMREQMFTLIRRSRPTLAERADLSRRFQALFKDVGAAARLANAFEAQLAKRAAS